MRGWFGRRREAAARRGESQRVHETHAGEYEGAMAVVRRSLAELAVARAHRSGSDSSGSESSGSESSGSESSGSESSGSVVPGMLRAAHQRIDEALARAAAAAEAVYTALFEAAGGTYHAESDPDVALWKRHMKNALTLRSQHQMSQLDDEVALRGSPVADASARTRAAFGPHQAGVDFDVHLDASA